jgi:hypothetical protein
MTKRRPKPVGKAPYNDREGVRYFEEWGYEDNEDTLFCEVAEFSTTLTFVCISRGRSSLRFVFRDEKNHVEYSMFQGGFEDMLKSVKIENGRVTGKFQHVRWGGNYGIEMILE